MAELLHCISELVKSVFFFFFSFLCQVCNVLSIPFARLHPENTEQMLQNKLDYVVRIICSRREQRVRNGKIVLSSILIFRYEVMRTERFIWKVVSSCACHDTPWNWKKRKLKNNQMFAYGLLTVTKYQREIIFLWLHCRLFFSLSPDIRYYVSRPESFENINWKIKRAD